MKIKADGLIGAALDWAIATCLGRTIKLDPMGFGCGTPEGSYWIWEDQESNSQKTCYWRIGGGYSPSSIWDQGGPIIEREGISVTQFGGAWKASTLRQPAVLGPTHLIAAMRCYVASVMGDEIELPEGLL